MWNIYYWLQIYWQVRWWYWPNHGRGRGKLKACGFELLNEELSSEQCIIIKWIRVVNKVFYFTDCIMFKLLCLAARWPDSDCFFFNWYHFPWWISLSIIDLILTRSCSKFKQLASLAEFVFVLGACRERERCILWEFATFMTGSREMILKNMFCVDVTISRRSNCGLFFLITY
jgi:hypothetical protein